MPDMLPSLYIVIDKAPQRTQVWSKATSTVGTGAEAKAGLRNVPIDFNGVTVNTVSSSSIFDHLRQMLMLHFREILSSVTR